MGEAGERLRKTTDDGLGRIWRRVHTNQGRPFKEPFGNVFEVDKFSVQENQRL